MQKRQLGQQINKFKKDTGYTNFILKLYFAKCDLLTFSLGITFGIHIFFKNKTYYLLFSTHYGPPTPTGSIRRFERLIGQYSPILTIIRRENFFPILYMSPNDDFQARRLLDKEIFTCTFSEYTGIRSMAPARNRT